VAQKEVVLKNELAVEKIVQKRARKKVQSKIKKTWNFIKLHVVGPPLHLLNSALTKMLMMIM